MSYAFEISEKLSLEETVQNLENDIHRFKKACLSDQARPIDYTNLLDAQFALHSLEPFRNISPNA